MEPHGAMIRFEVITDDDCLIVSAKSHQDAKACAEEHGHRVLATFIIDPDENSDPERIWDSSGYGETIRKY